MMLRISLRELVVFISGVAIGLSSAAYFSKPRDVIRSHPDFDFVSSKLSEFPKQEIWHLCQEIDNEGASLSLYYLIDKKYDELVDKQWPIPPNFIYRKIGTCWASETADDYLLEIWCDGKTIRYAFRRWPKGATKNEIVGDMNSQLSAWLKSK